ncbi:UrcA family protein [Altericroceibacterium xinjiangense]|uniref:UrcA family protein n=1 Tax=Altericroceibacterium xinjiangense TaxID=762261 RepID=UPI0013DF6F7C|nr:UrcA family protein [Altericroceibacterium xinjiangense]
MKIFTLVSAAAALALAAPAFAAQPAGNSVEVQYRDLDLSSPQGMAELDRRLDKAARQVCNLNATKTGTRIPDTESRLCYKETKDQLKQHIAAMAQKNRLG